MFYVAASLHLIVSLFLFPQSEEDRLQDQREKEELERHIRKFDTTQTRKVSSNLIAGMLCLISPEIVFVVLQYFECSRNVTWLDFSISFLGKIV